MLKVLIAEDDLMIADLIEDSLISAGYETCGIARTVNEAVAISRLHRPDLAVIDMRLADGGLGTEIAAKLPDGPRIGILYASGNVNQVMDLADRDACITKPYHIKDLLRALKIVEQIARNHSVSLPFPLGFHLLERTAPRLFEPSHA